MLFLPYVLQDDGVVIYERCHIGPEPYASMYCQQFDNFKNVADFFEFAARLMRR